MIRLGFFFWTNEIRYLDLRKRKEKKEAVLNCKGNKKWDW